MFWACFRGKIIFVGMFSNKAGKHAQIELQNFDRKAVSNALDWSLVPFQSNS
jgi:hypothetical protein